MNFPIFTFQLASRVPEVPVVEHQVGSTRWGSRPQHLPLPVFRRVMCPWGCATRPSVKMALASSRSSRVKKCDLASCQEVTQP